WRGAGGGVEAADLHRQPAELGGDDRAVRRDGVIAQFLLGGEQRRACARFHVNALELAAVDPVHPVDAVHRDDHVAVARRGNLADRFATIRATVADLVEQHVVVAGLRVEAADAQFVLPRHPHQRAAAVAGDNRVTHRPAGQQLPTFERLQLWADGFGFGTALAAERGEAVQELPHAMIPGNQRIAFGPRWRRGPGERVRPRRARKAKGIVWARELSDGSGGRERRAFRPREGGDDTEG